MTPTSSDHPNAAAICGFYEAFARGDHAAMAELYAPTVRFSDPVFEDLDYEHVTAMWRMFCSGDSDLAVTFTGVQADDTRGSAHWEAVYTFPPTGRRVHNKIDAAFEFRDGAVVRHRDSFNFYRWARMALGPAGVGLGWTPFLRAKVRTGARAQLDGFMAKERGASE